jgi:sulfur-oxidizing protein SoxZ
MAARTARIKLLPEQARRGDVVRIRCLVMHPMENGYRFDTQGTLIGIHLIHTVVCRYNGVEVFRANLGTGMAANPYLTFHTVAVETGTIEVSWHDDDGSVTSAQARIDVS